MPTPATRPRPPPQPWLALDFDAVARRLSTSELHAMYARVADEHESALTDLAHGRLPWSYDLAATCAARGILAREIADRLIPRRATRARAVA